MPTQSGFMSKENCSTICFQIWLWDRVPSNSGLLLSRKLCSPAELNTRVASGRVQVSGKVIHCASVQSWAKVLKITQILIFTKSAASVCMMAICIYSRMLWRVIRWIAINCKVSLCHPNELNPPQKHFHCTSALPQKDQLASCQCFSC